jgi:hypothetical protein
MLSHIVLNASYTHNKQLEGIGGIKERKGNRETRFH